MLTMCIESKENIGFRFDGNNEIDAQEFSKFLNETVNFFQTIINLSDRDVTLKLNINTFERGSFKIKATTIIKVSMKLFEKIKNAREVVNALKDIVEIKNILKNEIPKKVDKEKGQIILKNNEIINNGNILVLNIFDTEKNIGIIDNAINRFSQSIPENRNLDITDRNGTFKIDDSIKENLNKKFQKEDIKEIEHETLEKRTLIIKKPDLSLKSQWEFISDKVIKATILDEEFKKEVLERKFIAYHNQKIEVLLKTKIKLNEDSEILETHYEIEKVFLEDKTQLKLF